MIRAFIFDLDGVLTDTSEYHYLAWQRLADEERIPFTRQDNEALRGVSRRESLKLLLKGRPVSAEQAEALMVRKNSYYREMIQHLTPNDLLPGALQFVDEARAAGLKVAVASASKNAPEVIARLKLQDRIDVLADGSSVQRQKPAPDLFLCAAQRLAIPTVECVVVEDAAVGIAAAHAAGMRALGLGPPERVGAAEVVLPNLDGQHLQPVLAALEGTSPRVSCREP